MISDVTIKPLNQNKDLEVFRQIAALHIRMIYGGVLPLLGERFLTYLYREIAGSRYGRVYAVFDGGRVVGYVAGASDIWKCALGFSPGGYLRLGLILFLRIWRRSVLGKALDAVAYPLRKANLPNAACASLNRHRAELLAIAVDAPAQSRGVGRRLVQAMETFLRTRVSEYFVTTNILEKQSNTFYRGMGFSEAGRKRHHDLTIQIYVKPLTRAIMHDPQSL